MKNENNISEQELKEQAPILFSIQKKDDFKTPDGYFDTLPTRIQDAIHQEKTKRPVWLHFRIAIPMAAAVLIAFFFFLNSPTNNDIQLEELTAEEIQQTLEWEGYYNINDELLASAYSGDESAATEEITEEEIIDYLIYENMDINAVYY